MKGNLFFCASLLAFLLVLPCGCGDKGLTSDSEHVVPVFSQEHYSEADKLLPMECSPNAPIKLCSDINSSETLYSFEEQGYLLTAEVEGDTVYYFGSHSFLSSSKDDYKSFDVDGTTKYTLKGVGFANGATDDAVIYLKDYSFIKIDE